MDEARFRALMREALGGAEAGPWLAHAVRVRVARPVQPASRAPLFALVAGFLLFALLAIALVPRILNRASSVAPGGVATSSRAATPSPVAPLSCSLPVIIYDERVPPVVNGSIVVQNAGPRPDRWGFVDTRTGQFTVDPSASPVRGMPLDPPTLTPTGTQALSYSPAARRWLPVPPERMSPDGLSYAYIGDVYFRKLMRYDIATGKRVLLWAAPVQIGIIRWTANGILVNEGKPGSPQVLLVDPSTGVATPLPPATLPEPYQSAAAAYTLGTTAAGNPVREESVLNGPTVTIWVYYGTPDGKRVLIYHGTGPIANLTDSEGVMWHKGTGFDPGMAIADGGGIWFSTFAPSLTVWHWDAVRGLGRVDIGLPTPALPALIESVPAGPCF